MKKLLVLKIDYVHIVIFLLSVFFLSSCNTRFNIKKSKVKYFDKHFSGTFENKPYKLPKRNGDTSLLYIFYIRQVNSNKINIDFADSTTIKLSYEDNENLVQESFKGVFKKKGYFEIFFTKKRLEIPPLFPIIYSNVDIYRIRLAVTNEGELLIDQFWNRSGNIFILAAGGSGRGQYYFKRKL